MRSRVIRAVHPWNQSVIPSEFPQVLLNLLHFKNKTIELKFTLRGKPVGPTGLSYPFFPPISSPDGYKLMELYSKMAQSPVIAHQLCALQLFQARMNKNR